ncbi:hypothetical protein EVAR_86933_1 [Eumeta japonica]|uniref:Vitellogenin domain-containing protein n=1 Tax=Eumeta variegata TaxID=151549 RepID=A0A4C1W6J2_EUMVA|nr:hypothetical protein EVAR_86933_1 [Eumeta japonica]
MRQCDWSSAGSAAILVPNSRRIMRYELGAPGHAPRLVFAEELHEVRVAPELPLGLRARAWHRLEALDPSSVATATTAALSAATLLDALRIAEEEQARPLRAYRLQPSHIAHVSNASLHDKREMEEAVADVEEAEEGTVAAARAHLRLVAVLRAVPAATLNTLLERTAQHRPHRLGALLDAVAGANTPTAHTVAAAFLQLGADAPLPLAERYLAALPAARPPHEAVAMDVLRLAENERTPSQLAQAARLSVGAMAAYAESPLAVSLIGGLSRLLAKCSDAECRALLIRALGNSRREEVLSILLDYAASVEPAPAAAALHALLTLSRHLRLPDLDRIANIALGLDIPRPLHVRAVAIDALLSGAAMVAEHRELSVLPPIIYRFWKELEVRGPAVLRHTTWTRLELLAEQNDAARVFLKEALWMRSNLGVWTANIERMAASGTVRRALGGAVAECPLWLESTQLVLGGALRRGAVAVRASKLKTLCDILELEVTTQGLQNIVGGGDFDSDDDDNDGDVNLELEAEGPSAWLAVSIAGERWRPLTLFQSQAELLGHVWAGTASEPVTVVAIARAFHAAPPAMLPLLTGGTLIWEARSALALRLDAQLQVSLWNRVAQTLVELRAGGAVELKLETHTVGLVLRAEGTGGAEPALDVDANIDFYDRPTLCVMPQLQTLLTVERGGQAGVMLYDVSGHRRDDKTERARVIKIYIKATAPATLLYVGMNGVGVELLRSLGLFVVHQLGTPTGESLEMPSKKDNRAKHSSLKMHAATFAAISTTIAVPLTDFGKKREFD